MERKDYKRYSREFKLEAVRLASLGKKPKAQIARDLGIRVNQWRNWRLEFELEDRYYAARRRLPSLRALRRTGLTSQIRTIHEASRHTYGSPRVHAELFSQGVPCCRNTVAKLMRKANIVPPGMRLRVEGCRRTRRRPQPRVR
jgi:transposase-like protein